MREYDASDLNDYKSSERYQTVYYVLMIEEEKNVEFLQKLLSGKFGFMCQYDRKDGFAQYGQAFLT